ncbi:MAG: peroxide stress protein YaaA [Desulfobulbaceae bacterium]|nr:peroxide stress protein YaaA [Desulfobulbaceae bacterium]
MLLVISPSKTQKFDNPCPEEFTLPAFLPEIETLVKRLQAFDPQGLAGLMSLSEKLAVSTWQRFKDFSASFEPANSRPALLAFRGDVYGGIKAEDFSPADFKFAQQHLRIISGLYGLLSPLDLIQPYRLEMKTKLSTAAAPDLYGFWADKIIGALNRDLAITGNTHLVNLASREYFKAVKPALLESPVLEIVFKVWKDGQYKVIGIHAKRARGMMVNFVIDHRLDAINDLKKFRADGYLYNDSLSSELQWVFCKG